MNASAGAETFLLRVHRDYGPTFVGLRLRNIVTSTGGLMLADTGMPRICTYTRQWTPIYLGFVMPDFPRYSRAGGRGHPEPGIADHAWGKVPSSPTRSGTASA
jgi:hypothetical protein